MPRGGHGRDGGAGKAAMTLGTGSFARTAMRVSVAALVLSGSIYAAFGAGANKSTGSDRPMSSARRSLSD
jgi:hypothetical protein